MKTIPSKEQIATILNELQRSLELHRQMYNRNQDEETRKQCERIEQQSVLVAFAAKMLGEPSEDMLISGTAKAPCNKIPSWEDVANVFKAMRDQAIKEVLDG